MLARCRIRHVRQRDAGPAGEQFQRLAEVDLLELLHELNDVAVLAARPAAVALAARIDVERRTDVVVERAQTLEAWPAGCSAM